MRLTWIKLNFKFLLKRSGTLVGILYSILGFIATWCPLENILSPDTTIWCKLTFSSLILLATLLISFMTTAIWYYLNNTVCVIEKGNGRKVFVRYGDFIKELKQPTEDRRNFIITSNRCFDTIVDDKLISSNTIQGQFFKSKMGGGNLLYYIHIFQNQPSFAKYNWLQGPISIWCLIPVHNPLCL